MGKIGKGKQLVSLSLPREWLAEIDRRADALNLTRATYCTLIVAKWWKEGKAPVTEPDRFMQMAAASKQPDTKRN